MKTLTPQLLRQLADELEGFLNKFPNYYNVRDKNGKFVKRTRKFRHKNGFNDSTDYIECDGGDTYLVSKNGKRTLTFSWPIEYCKDMVKQGYWVEF